MATKALFSRTMCSVALARSLAEALSSALVGLWVEGGLAFEARGAGVFLVETLFVVLAVARVGPLYGGCGAHGRT